jgi:putative transposase
MIPPQPPDLGGLNSLEDPMPRRTVLFLPDLYYHFYNRGNNRQAVVFERDNYLYFLRGVKKYLSKHVDILAYCLMPTHYHILGRVRDVNQTPETQTSRTQNSEFLKNSEVLANPEVSAEEMSNHVSQAMMRLTVSYTKAINKRFNRAGALFQGQFQGKPIQQYNHLLNLCIYIHSNPVKNGLVEMPEDWEFSNYLEWMNLRAGRLVNRDFISDNFGEPQDYKSLVKEYIRTRTLPDEVKDYLQDLDDFDNDFQRPVSLHHEVA